MNDLRVSIIQSSLHWEDPEANRKMFAEIIAQNNEERDLYLLPEMFTTGFSMNAEQIAEADAGETTLQWMKGQAKTHNAAICGSVSVKDEHQYFNRLFWVKPDGSHDQYDKKHLFTFAGEHDHYSPGSERIIVEYKGWKICPLICYDLRFPVWSRNRLKQGEAEYDLLIYVANWPAVRRDPWMKLLFARSIENQCYTIGLNRIGEDGNGILYSGDSLIIDPKGLTVSSPESQDGVRSADLSFDELHDFRKKFPVLHDADKFELK